MDASIPNAFVTGLGTFLPQRVVPNADLEESLDTSDTWIRERTGIHSRHIVDPKMATSDMAIEAGRAALKDAGVAPEDVDLIVLGTYTPDYQFPATSCIIQNALGCVNAGAFDVESACSGWIAAFSTGTMWIRGGGAKTVLALGSDCTSRALDWTDRTTAVLFGDAAAAAVLQAQPQDSEGIEVLSTYIRADGSGLKHLHMPAGGSRKPATLETVQAREHYIKMEGRATYKFAVKALSECVLEACKRADIEVKNLDWVIPHQANLRIIEASARRVNIDMDRYVINIQKYGNTVAASIGLALHEAREEKKFLPGHTAALVGMGAGLTWGGIALRWNP